MDLGEKANELRDMLDQKVILYWDQVGSEIIENLLQGFFFFFINYAYRKK